MKPIPLLLSLLLGGLAVQAAGASTSVEAETGDLEALKTEYREAFQAWKARYDEAEREEKVALRDEHPVHEHWPRFEGAAEAGEGRAYLWMLDHVRQKRLAKDEKGPVLRGIFDALLEGFADRPWFDEVVARLPKHARHLGKDTVQKWLSDAAGRVEAPMAAALVKVRLAELLKESDDPAEQERGESMLAAYERENVLPGAPALVFEASTIDGHEFELSDYRGKAVLLDFYGFW